MRIGFVGTGVISCAVITALMTSARTPDRITVSPRNANRAAALSERYSQVVVGSSNQDVVDNSDIVCLGVRPQDAETALAPLRFQSAQVIVSFISTFSTEELQALVHPAGEIYRAAPLPAIAKHLGPITVFPGGPHIRELFGDLGTLVEVANEDELQTLWSVTAMMASYFRLQESAHHWLASHDVAEERAKLFIASMFHALADTGLQETDSSFGQLATEHATPRGLNEQLMRELAAMGCFDSVEEGLSLILKRMQGAASFEDSLNRRT